MGFIFNFHWSNRHIDPDNSAITMNISLFHLKSGCFPGIQESHVIHIFFYIIRMRDAHPVDLHHFFHCSACDSGKYRIHFNNMPRQ